MDKDILEIMLELAEDENDDLKKEISHLIQINHSLWNYVNYLMKGQANIEDKIDKLLDIKNRLN